MSKAEFKMQASLPKIQEKMWVYITKGPSEEKGIDMIKSIGATLGLKGEYTDTPDKFVVADGMRVLERFKESGAIWYGDRSKLGSMELKAELPTEEEVKSKATNLLKTSGLLPEEAYFKQVGETSFTKLNPELKESSASITTEKHAHFGFKLEDIPVIGAGAKIKVTYGDKGEVIEVLKNWRDIERHKQMQAIKISEAIEKLQNSHVFADLVDDSRVTIDDVYVAYYARSVLESQKYIFPVYVFEGTIETPNFRHKFTNYVSAISLEEMKTSGIAEETLFKLPTKK